MVTLLHGQHPAGGEALSSLLLGIPASGSDSPGGLALLSLEESILSP